MGGLKLLSVKDMTERWGKSDRTIRRYVSEGILVRCANVPGVFFREDYIEQIELDGMDIKPFSPFERRRMEKTIKELEIENERLKKCLIQTHAIITQEVLELQIKNKDKKNIITDI